jgi:hypothetical protein
VLATGLDTLPGARYVYSDLNFILLGTIVARVTGEPLDAYGARHVFAPLGMRDTRYAPDPRDRARTAPTEFDPWRQRHLRGEVHDENAYALGRVAGHAGLFSTGADLARLARAYLTAGSLDGRPVFDAATVAEFTRVQDTTLSRRALGWETPTGGNSAGHYLSRRAFGHTGFTGTSLWIDPERGVYVILLSNRVNPRARTRGSDVSASRSPTRRSRRSARRPSSPPPAPPSMNRFSVADWTIVVGYFLLTAAVGLVYTRRAGASTSEFFIGGRNVPWWLAGVSMVATTFAADTPLAVTELVAKYGVAGNWLWWNAVMSGILTVFFFARLWRRANVMTDVELAEVRYGGRPAAALRGFRAVYLAVPINLIILGWVNKAMVTILEVSLGINPIVAIGICFVVTVAYSAAAGLWAVLWTDAVQFVIMMTAVIVLAVFA